MLDYGEFVESFHLSIQKAEALGLKGEELSAKALEFFQLDCGGVNLYIPKGHISRVGNRKNAIKREFNGTNHAELAKKYGVSIQWVYEILKGNLNNNRKRERTKKRNESIVKLYDGKNIEELSDIFKLSKRHISDILAKHQEQAKNEIN